MTRLLESSRITDLAREESVRGTIIRTVLEQAKHADDEEVALLENALELLLTRFQSLEGEAP